MRIANPEKTKLKDVALQLGDDLERGDYKIIADKARCSYESVRRTFSPSSSYCHIEVAHEAKKLLKSRERKAAKLIENVAFNRTFPQNDFKN